MNISDMIGKTFTYVSGEDGGEEMLFENDKEFYRFFHYQDCCECVRIVDIVGDIDDLIGEPILIAEEVSNLHMKNDDTEYYDESSTWTFYKFATRKGYVDVRWLGESNGYYSESVDIEHFVKDTK